MGPRHQKCLCECHLGQGNEAGSFPPSSHSGRCFQGAEVFQTTASVSVSSHTHPAENSLEEVICAPAPPAPPHRHRGPVSSPCSGPRSDYAVETNIKSLCFAPGVAVAPRGDREPGRCLQRLPSRVLLRPRTLLPANLSVHSRVNNQKDELTTV